MNEKLIKEAHKLRSRGFTTGEIADELNVSKDTAIGLFWGCKGKTGKEHEKAPWTWQ